MHRHCRSVTRSRMMSVRKSGVVSFSQVSQDPKGPVGWACHCRAGVIIKWSEKQGLPQVKSQKLLINKEKGCQKEGGSEANTVLITPGVSNLFRSFGILFSGSCMWYDKSWNFTLSSVIFEKHVRAWDIFSPQTTGALPFKGRLPLNFTFFIERCMKTLPMKRLSKKEGNSEVFRNISLC